MYNVISHNINGLLTIVTLDIPSDHFLVLLIYISKVGKVPLVY